MQAETTTTALFDIHDTIQGDMETIYKYLPPPRLTYLNDELLRFTQPSELNDPFECLPKISNIDLDKLFKGIVHRNKIPLNFINVNQALMAIKEQYRKNPKMLMDLFFEKHAQTINNSIGILSMSKNCDHSLMWGHYTGSHRGICIGFDPAHQFFSKCESAFDDIGKLRPVSYDEERLPMSLSREMKIPKDVWYRKSKIWEYEGEVRLIRLLSENDKKMPDNNGGPAIYLFKVPHSAIKEIVIGGLASVETRSRIRDFCAGRQIQRYQMKYSLADYSMNKAIVE